MEAKFVTLTTLHADHVPTQMQISHLEGNSIHNQVTATLCILLAVMS